MKKVIIGGGIAAAVGLVAALGYAAVASGGASPHLLPYVGHLDHDGTPVTGKVALKVCLVSNIDTACDKATWFEEFDSVDVAGGNFSLVLGQTKPIDDATGAAGNLYIRAMVGATVAQGTPTFVQLSGAQQVLSVPFAINANQGTSFHLEGQIYKGGTVPGTSVPGLTSENFGEGIKLVSNGADIGFSRAGNSANQFAPPANYNSMTIQSNGVVLGENSLPIRQVTFCRQYGGALATPNKQVWFKDSDCTHKLPRGTCFAMLSQQNDCAGGVDWSIQMPQDNNGASGMRWYNPENCGNGYGVAATFLCAFDGNP